MLQALLSASASMKFFNDEELILAVDHWRNVAHRQQSREMFFRHSEIVSGKLQDSRVFGTDLHAVFFKLEDVF